jgi:uncharacterized membrane protein
MQSAAEPNVVLPVPGPVQELVRGYGRGRGGVFKIRMMVVVPRPVVFWIRARFSAGAGGSRRETGLLVR